MRKANRQINEPLPEPMPTQPLIVRSEETIEHSNIETHDEAIQQGDNFNTPGEYPGKM